MGEVYLAEDTPRGLRVALKILPTEFTQHTERIAGFLFKARDAFGVLSKFSGQNFERNTKTAGRVFGQIDFTHPACAELVEDAIVSNVLFDHTYERKNKS